jgi:hypothetical protein
MKASGGNENESGENGVSGINERKSQYRKHEWRINGINNNGIFFFFFFGEIDGEKKANFYRKVMAKIIEEWQWRKRRHQLNGVAARKWRGEKRNVITAAKQWRQR